MSTRAHVVLFPPLQLRVLGGEGGYEIAGLETIAGVLLLVFLPPLPCVFP
jgi:hypothetical protein